MKKSFIKISIFFVVIFLFVAIYINNVYASNETVIASGNCGDSITWTLDGDGVLSISGSGEMTSNNASAWADYQQQVKSVIISEGITSIADCAFELNKNIENINLPSTVTSIGRRAFAECSNLKSITLPNGFTRIGTSAFYQCTSLETIDLPSSIMYINTCAFAECSALKSIKIRSFYVSIGDDSLTINDTATIYGYNFSNAFYYARYYGRNFVDLETNKTSKETITKDSYLNALPTVNVKALGITGHHGRSFMGNTFKGYESEFCNKKDAKNEVYNEIKAKVEELTANSSTDREKAYAIFSWVYNNVTYQYASSGNANIESVYKFYKNLKGNCEVYTLLTNYMLYLCDIPTATVTNLTHMWTAAFIDGKWIYIDSTHYLFDGTNSKPNQLTFAYDGLVYAIDDPTIGAYVTGIAKEDLEIENLSNFTIPTNSYMKGIYETSFSAKLELKSKIGTIGETFIKNNRKCYSISNNIITGLEKHNENKKVIKNKVEATCTQNGHYDEILHCSNCNKEMKTTRKTISPSGHKYTTKITKNATCNTKGKNTYTCSKCNDSYTKEIPLTSHTYKTQLENGYNITKCSICKYVKSKKIATPSKVSGLKASSNTTKKIKISWNKTKVATGYNIYQYNTSTKKWKKIKTTTSKSYTISGLKAGKTYKFKVRAYNKVKGTTKYGSYSSILTTSTKPSSTKVTSLKSKSKKATIKWKKVSGASGYQIYMSTSKKGKYSKIKTITKGSIVKYTKTKLKKNKKYYFKIRAYRTVDGKKVYSSYCSTKSIKIK